MDLIHPITAYGAACLSVAGAAALLGGIFFRRRRLAKLALLFLAAAGPMAGLAWLSGWWSARRLVPFSDAAEIASLRHRTGGFLATAVALGSGLCALWVWSFLRRRGRIPRIVVLLIALLGLAGAVTLGQSLWWGRTLQALQSGDNPPDLPLPEPPDHLVIGQPPGPFEEE